MFCRPPPACSTLEISRKHAPVKDELVGVINHLIARVRRGNSVRVRYCVIYLPPDNLDEVRRGVRLAEGLVNCDPVRVPDNGVCRVQVSEQIQRTGSSVAQIWPM